MKFLILALSIAVGMLLLSCGQKGPLYLPDSSSSAVKK